MYTLLYTEQFRKQLSKLERDARRRIIAALERIRIRPYPYVKRLVASPYYRLRVGDYRVILDIQDKDLVIYTLEVGHRKVVYR